MDAAAIEAFLDRSGERRQELARLVQEDEVENEEFYRGLGDRLESATEGFSTPRPSGRKRH
jgi:hypothetical protein